MEVSARILINKAVIEENREIDLNVSRTYENAPKLRIQALERARPRGQGLLGAASFAEEGGAVAEI